MCEVLPSLEQCSAALADVVEAGGRPDLAQELRDHPRELDEAEFTALAHELGVQSPQLFHAYLFRVYQLTGFAHRALADARLQQVTRQ